MMNNGNSLGVNYLNKLQRLSSRLYQVWKTQGSKQALAKIFKKIYLKLEGNPQAIAPEVNQPCPVFYHWIGQNSVRESDLIHLAEIINIFKYKPVISVIMPVYNTPDRYLREAIESVINQVYPYWELCIADDASTAPHIQPLLQEYAEKDARIKVVYRPKNGHISAASNSALEITTGEYIALFDHDDLLTPDALYHVALMINRHPEADMIYTDEDKITDNNIYRDPCFKPDWCPDTFLSRRMYTCHLGIYRRSLVNEIGGFRLGFEGSQDYDLALRLTEKTTNIFHIPRILYHWRIHANSTASNFNNKDYATEAALKALAEALQRRNEPAEIKLIQGGHSIVRYHIQDYSKVTVIIPTRDLGNVLNTCLTSIFEKTTYPNYEVLLIDNGSTEARALEVIDKWKTKEPDRFRCEVYDIPFNYSKLNNYGVSKANGKYLLFLNNDTEVLTPDWMTAMVEQAQRPSIGAVGALLLYPDNTIQHAGVVIGLGGVACHSHKNFPADHPGYFYQIQTVNNYSAVTAACLMCRREVCEEVGGWEETLQIAFNDVDFCLKIIDKGYRNIYLPHVILYHYESKSRGIEDTPEKLARFQGEIDYIQAKWKHIIDDDPCYNPHLTRGKEDYSIRI